jgi:hypothetical protein
VFALIREEHLQAAPGSVSSLRAATPTEVLDCDRALRELDYDGNILCGTHGGPVVRFSRVLKI